MNKNTDLLGITQAIFKYTDVQMEVIKSNPKIMHVIKKIPQLATTDFVFEIDEAHGCGIQHKQGQKIVINGNGSLLCSDSNPNICMYLLQSLTPVIYGAQEFIYAGLDPNDMKFTKVGCLDVGVKCGGFGHVSVNFKAIPKQ